MKGLLYTYPAFLDTICINKYSITKMMKAAETDKGELIMYHNTFSWASCEHRSTKHRFFILLNLISKWFYEVIATEYSFANITIHHNSAVVEALFLVAIDASVKKALFIVEINHNI